MNSLVKYLSIVTLGASMVCTSARAIAEDGAAKPEGDAPKRERPQRDGDGEKRERPDRGAREGGPMGRIFQVVQELNLTDDQKTQIKEIGGEVREKMQALREELKDASPEDRRARVQEVMAPYRDKVMNILTDDQKAQLKEKMESARGARDGEGRRAGPRDGEGEKNGPRDGERPRRGPRDGEGEKKGPRDGDDAKDGPRDND